MEARILVVDDEEAVASMLKIVFETDGYNVATASSAVQAVALLSGQRFDAVITDMKMETETAGYEVVRAARALPDPPAVVILTAYPLLAKDWRTAGADAAVSKPANMARLLETVADILDKRRR